MQKIELCVLSFEVQINSEDFLQFYTSSQAGQEICDAFLTLLSSYGFSNKIHLQVNACI